AQTSQPIYIIGEHRLTNLAIRNTLTEGESLITGFVVSNPSTATLLVRATGPSLSSLGVVGTMSNPKLQVINSAGRVVAENDDWSPERPPSSAENPAWSIQNASVMVGAFPLDNGSRDAAVVVTLPPGAYTLVISGSTAVDAGVVLGEVYHMPVLEALSVAVARGNKPSSRLVNLSVRGRIAGSVDMIGGFVVGGGLAGLGSIDGGPIAPLTKRYLIRVVGPALAGFGVTGTLADPTLELAGTAGTVLQSNDNWEADPAAAATIRAATTAAGAFPLPAGSRDAAVVVRLQEGAYTVLARGLNGATGVGLIEIYELAD
ncbi:MAG: hypothetical protein V4773_15385, partial [Verrucomicrobiota bacterium]